MADGENVADLIPPEVRYIHLGGSPTIGTKRNAGCGMARGTVIAHHDDDDFSAPGRLADQVARLVESGKSVTGYGQMRFTDGVEWWQYRGEHGYALGTSLCYRRDWWTSHKFPDMQIEEDAAFVRMAADAGQFTAGDAGDLMWATIHPGNTSPRQLVGSKWQKL